MKQLFLVLILVCIATQAKANDCVQQCEGRYVDYNARVVCTQICTNTEAQREINQTLKELVSELKKQTKLITGGK